MNTPDLEQNPDSPIALSDGASEVAVSKVNPVVGHIMSCYELAKQARRTHDSRWLDAYANFRGNPSQSKAFISTEVSRAFIKITKTKTLAAYAQLLEVVLSKGVLPIEITASPVPVGADEAVHIDPNDPLAGAPAGMGQQVQAEVPPSPVGFHGDGQDLEPGATLTQKASEWIKKKFGEMVKIKPGYGDSPDRIVFMPAKEAAFNMNKRIHDQLEDTDAITLVRQATLEMCMLGTGILKGPFNRKMEYPNWDDQGKYSPIIEEIPVLKHVSLWNWYPDPEATTYKQADYAIERHKMSVSQMRDLKRFRSFMSDAIDKVILEKSPQYVNESFEDVLDESASKPNTSRYEVLEYWGKLDVTLLEDLDIDFGFDIPEGMEELNVNVWVCAGEIIRFVLNPLTPARLPYFVCPYEFNPYSIFGVGVPENMQDTQTLMNGFMRLAVDNAVLSGSVMLEVDESVLAPGQDYVVETGKVFRKTGGAANQRGVQSITITNTSQQNMQMFDAARRLADEATGIPSFSHGMTGVQGVGRTSSGISQLLGAASQTIKTVVLNMDEYWFKPIGKGWYHWNMQYKFDPKIKGDLSVSAKASMNLMQKEVLSQRLMQFAQVGFSNPALAPWINGKEWLKWFGESLDFDPRRILNAPDEAALQAQLIQMAGGAAAQGSPPGEQQGPGVAPPTPGQPGFTGVPQQTGPQGMNNEQSVA